MPNSKKKLTDRPTEEAIKKLFPKKAVDKMKEVAHEKDKKNDDSGVENVS